MKPNAVWNRKRPYTEQALTARHVSIALHILCYSCMSSCTITYVGIPTKLFSVSLTPILLHT